MRCWTPQNRRKAPEEAGTTLRKRSMMEPSQNYQQTKARLSGSSQGNYSSGQAGGGGYRACRTSAGHPGLEGGSWVAARGRDSGFLGMSPSSTPGGLWASRACGISSLCPVSPL